MIGHLYIRVAVDPSGAVALLRTMQRMRLVLAGSSQLDRQPRVVSVSSGVTSRPALAVCSAACMEASSHIDDRGNC